MSQTILVVAAHPDDEVLGMGGTIARHVIQGDRVHVLFLGDGVGARSGSETHLVEERCLAAQSALSVMGAQPGRFLTFPDNRFDSVPLLEIIQAIEVVKRELLPTMVYTHHGGDLNVDHQIACQAVLTAFRPQPEEHCREILSFEVASATEWASPRSTAPFLPETFVEITPHLAILEEACRCYGTELRADPHARSLEAILIGARKRGREVGVEAAEAFMTLRRILR